MVIILILILSEVLTFKVIRKYFYEKSWVRYFFITLLNFSLSIFFWAVVFQIMLFRGFYDDPRHISLLMTFNGLIAAVLVPRIIFVITYYAVYRGKRKPARCRRLLSATGNMVSLFIFSVVVISSVSGRFNFRTEHVNLKITGLHQDLNGLKIALISDLHLPSFHHHTNKLLNVMEEINEHDPDFIMNTGDFITYGWREFGRHDTILKIAGSRYGNFAVMGNHDFGTYHPYFTEADIKNNVRIINKKIEASGYRVLNDEHIVIEIDSARVGIAGVITMGSFPEIIHGNLDRAIQGMNDTDIDILLTHDPNHWLESVRGKTDISLTLSGHTHGMQLGILTKKFRWSPAKYFYSCWGGTYSEDNQFLIVNRGLGVLGFPVRVWMPPEITIITLEGE